MAPLSREDADALDAKFGYGPAKTQPGLASSEADEIDRLVLSGGAMPEAPAPDQGPAKAGFLESLAQVPEQLGRTLAAGLGAGGVGTMGMPWVYGELQHQEDLAAAEKGDFEAAKRLRAQQTVAMIPGMVAPMGPGIQAGMTGAKLAGTLAQQAAFGAGAAGLGAGAEAAAQGEPIAPAALQGAAIGAVMNPAIQGLGYGFSRLMARRAERTAERVADDLADEAPRIVQPAGSSGVPEEPVVIAQRATQNVVAAQSAHDAALAEARASSAAADAAEAEVARLRAHHDSLVEAQPPVEGEVAARTARPEAIPGTPAVTPAERAAQEPAARASRLEQATAQAREADAAATAAEVESRRLQGELARMQEQAGAAEALAPLPTQELSALARATTAALEKAAAARKAADDLSEEVLRLREPVEPGALPKPEPVPAGEPVFTESQVPGVTTKLTTEAETAAQKQATEKAMAEQHTERARSAHNLSVAQEKAAKLRAEAETYRLHTETMAENLRRADAEWRMPSETPSAKPGVPEPFVSESTIEVPKPPPPPTKPRQDAVRRELFSELRKKAGGKTPPKEERLQIASNILGREIKSYKEMTTDEAAEVAQVLRQMRLAEAGDVAPILAMEQSARNLENQRGIWRPSTWEAGWKDAQKLFNRTVTSGASYLEKMGPAGQALGRGMLKAAERMQGRTGLDLISIKRLTEHLSEKELEDVGKVMGGIAEGTERTAAAAQAVREIADTYADDAVALKLRELTSSGDRIPFRRMEQWFPQIIKDEVKQKLLTEGSAEERLMIQQILDRGLETTPDKAKALLKQFTNHPPEIRSGSLQHARELVIPDEWREWNVLKAMQPYIMSSARRIEVAREFGARDEKAIALVNALIAGGKDGVAASRLYNALVNPRMREFQGLAKLTGTFHTVSLLWTSGIIQPAQMLNTASKYGYLNTLRGLAQIFSKNGSDWAEGTGAAVIDLLHDITPDGRSIASKWTKVIGLEQMDRANRLTAALAGRFRAEQIAKKLVEQPTSSHWMRQAEQLGLDAKGIVSRGGVLTNDELRQAALRAANDTQFASTVLDLPYMRNTPQGQFMYLFKSFTLQQGRFVKNLVKEAKQGNPGPLLRYAAGLATFGAGMGEMVADIRAWVRKKDRPDSAMQRYIEDMSFAGGIGIISDAVNAMERGPDAIAAFIGGPAFAEFAMRLPAETAQAAQGEPEALMRHAISRVPVAGYALADWLVP